MVLDGSIKCELYDAVSIPCLTTMIKDPTVAEALTEQALRLRRHVQNRFATLPLPLATYVPPFLSRINRTRSSRAICVFAVMLILNIIYFCTMAAAPAAPHVVVEPQWVASTTTAPAPATPAPAPQPQRLSVDIPVVEEPPKDGKGHAECQRYLANYTDRADHHCGVVDVEERVVCLSEREALLHYGGQQFWRSPVIYRFGDKKVAVSAQLAQCPEHIQTTAYLPYSVIFLDADDQRHRVTIQEDTCLQILHNALSGAPLCTTNTVSSGNDKT